MSSVTAQIIIGESHPNHGGIIPIDFLNLHENSRPVFLLEKESKQFKWIPTLEHTVDDMLLMIAVHILKDENVIQLLQRLVPKYDIEEQGDAFELYELLNNEQRQQLYALNKQTINKYSLKVAISIFEESLLRGQLSLFKDYEIDMEVCISIYSRFYSNWREEVVVSGSLDL